MSSDLTYGIRISAQDDSGPGLRSALAGFLGFAKDLGKKPIEISWRLAKGGLGLARDFEQGVRPLVEGIDRVIERGTGLEVVRKSFEALTGKHAGADGLARQLAVAANGTLKLSEAMQIANRGMASGMGLDQIATALDFISKKSITTGKESGQAIDKVMTGLSRGSTLFLDDFGILVDGLEGVKRTYESIKGAGAWEALGPAGQKAETIRQAIAEMRQQLGKIGVSGRESVFMWAKIKNEIGDAVDRLFGAVGRSKDFQETLRGVRDIISGVARHVEGGKSIWDALFGKEGGKSGGLWGGIKAALMDVGEWAGRGVLRGILLGLAEIPHLLGKIKGGLGSLWDEALTRIEARFKQISETFRKDFEAAVTPVLDRFQPIIDWVSKQLGGKATSQPSGEAAMAAAPGEVAREVVVHGGAYGVGRLSGMVSKQAAAEAASAAALRATPLAGDVAGAAGLGTSITGWLARKLLGVAGPAAVIGDFLWTTGKYGYANYDYYRALQEQAQAQGMLRRTQEMARQRPSAASSEQPLTLGLPGEEPLGLGLGVGFGLWNGITSLPRRVGNWFARMADRVAAGGGPSRTGAWMGQYREEFSGSPEEEPADVAIPLSALDPAAYPARARQRRDAKREIYKINAEIRKEQAAQDHKDKYEVAKLTKQAVHELRAEGADVRRKDWPGISQEIAAQLRAEREGRLNRLVERRDELYRELETSDRARALDPWERRRGLHRVPEPRNDRRPVDMTDTRGQTDPITQQLMGTLQAFVSSGAAIVGELADAGRRIRTARVRA